MNSKNALSLRELGRAIVAGTDVIIGKLQAAYEI